ncbi:bifunctional metallophosphatase/5'-nucleotidase [Cutibacterium sp. WCA-380-WT-3A]|uniref:Bifunctional metallophosphatase/5'-nucleotidase n=1 Tax=Cutibacterium porci TaxID=2605781 RepID=A0A7K0J8P1_9ACTN|nr:5'-nucleotidase C-terminal domain-containing protein [Cutibacterium porci]MSS46327.1 bifunctional metallophosphatase/5'-nucleotidase [Cutibacterium porci]
MNHRRRAHIAGVSVLCVTVGSFAVNPAIAAPSTSDTPSPAAASCNGDKNVDIFNFNDFHGRIATGANLFSPVVEDRNANGADKVLLLNAGDNVGGSTFESGSLNDEPTIDMLKAAGVEANTVGNHEFDKGWKDLADRVVPHIGTPYLGANVYEKGTTTVAAPLKASTVIVKDGVRIGVVGAVTHDLPSLVSPAGISNLTIGDPVKAVNAEAKRLKSEGLADIVIAEYHEGAADGSGDAASQGGNFAPIYATTSSDVDLVFNGHTHQVYSWKDNAGAPLLQAGSYGQHLAKVKVAWDSQQKKLCSTDASIIDPAKTPADDPTIAKISSIYDDAKAKSDSVGATVIGHASAPITTPSNESDQEFGANVRDRESTMTNMVADMFKDTLGKDDPNFIGLQNPGGTRASLLDTDITYKQAAQVLPFANTLTTTKITGAQFKKVLEQQWQRDENGEVPSRPYLQLGVSSNVTYTYDESRKEGDRITSVWVNGKPMDPNATYTVGSGSFLIAGGDNFTELAKGSKPVDSGKIDLSAWVDWIKAHKTLKPDFAKRAVSLTTSLHEGMSKDATFTLGKPAAKAVAPDTVDFTSKGAVANTTMKAQIVQGTTTVDVATAPVKDGSSSVTVTVPTDKGLVSGPATVLFTFPDSGTVVRFAAVISVPTVGNSTPGGVSTPGGSDATRSGVTSGVTGPGDSSRSNRPGLPSTGV